MEEIDLKELITIFWEKKATIILITAIFMVLGFIYSSFLVVPKYEAATTILLVQTSSEEGTVSGITSNDITLNSKLISTYSDLVKSKRVIRKVISNLGINDSEDSIKNSVQVTAKTDTAILEIKVKHTEPQKSADIANEIAKVFAEEVKELYKINNVSTIDVAEPNETPSNVNLKKDIIMFGAIGFVLGAGIIFVTFMLDNSIKSGEDVEKAVKVPVLASIPIYEPEMQVGSRSARNKKASKGGKRK